MKYLQSPASTLDALHTICLPTLRDRQLSSAELDIVAALAVARTSQECDRLFWEAGHRYEIGSFSSGEIDLNVRSRIVFFGMQWTESWRAFYLANDYLARDPLLRFLSDTEEPFTWQEQLRGTRLTNDEKSIFRKVAEHGWIDGFVLPIQRKGSHVGLVSVVCRRVLDQIQDKPFLTALSFCYFERMRAVLCSRDFPVPPMGLTPRELQCLALVAQGDSDKAISTKLKISMSTAHEHVQRAMGRIGVRSRMEAVAIATSFGIFRPC